MTREVGRVLSDGENYPETDQETRSWVMGLLDGTEVTVHDDDLRCQPELLVRGAIITCVVKRGVAKQPYAEEVSLLAAERDARVLAHCLISDSPDVVEAAAENVARKLDSAVIPALVRKLLALTKSSIPGPLADKLTDGQLLVSSAADLRTALPQKRALRLYQAHDRPRDFAEEIEHFARSLKKEDAAGLWSNLATKIEYGDSLYRAAPDDLKIDILSRKYEHAQQDWEDWLPDFVGEYGVATSEVYGSNLTEQDNALARAWAGEGANVHDMARMVSARGAEKVAKQFYESIGSNVTDTSITQLEGDGAWRTYDLRLDSGKLLDVKNARAVKERPDRYVEHVVPKFKEDRVSGQDVVIVGVFSPYYSLDRIRAGTQYGSIKMLGETTLDRLDALSHTYSRGAISIQARGRNMIPAWAFSYPEQCYRDRADLDAKWAALVPGLPSVREQELLGQNLVPPLLRARLPLPHTWQSELGKPICELYEQLRLVPRLTLADLFLSLLNHLIDQGIKSPPAKDFDPQDYQRLLFPSDHDRDRPAGVMDPLRIMDEWCDTLQTLWEHRDEARLPEFNRFWFQGSGLLQASRASAPTTKVSLLAYCGGSVKGVKCGHSPLVIGREKTCESCGKLVCPKCGCCTAPFPGLAPCSKCIPRMARSASANAKR